MRFFRRLPRRGFNNNAFRLEWSTVNVGLLEGAFQSGETVTLELAIARGVVRRNAERLKVLGDGELTKALTLEPSIAVSVPAREKIEKAGGKVGAPLPKKPAPDFKKIAADQAKAAKAEAAAKAELAKAEAKAKGEAQKGEGQKGEGQKGEGPKAERPAKGERPPKGERPAGDAKKGDGHKGDGHKGDAKKAARPGGDKKKSDGGDAGSKHKKK
jgi:hypothetical protein